MAENTLEKLQRVLSEVLSVKAEKIVPEARFSDDLDADSLDVVESVMALEEAFAIEIDEKELEGMETVGQLLQLIESKLSG